MSQTSVIPVDPELEAIALGALPSSARRRLDELTRLPRLSTSFLTAAEDALAAGEGILPLGQVVGCAALRHRGGVVRAFGPGSGSRRLGGQPRWLDFSGPPDTWRLARERAVHRIREQAAILGADAVVGVRVTRRLHDLLAEVELIGTAVKLGSPAAAPPVVTALTVQEIAKLRASGAEPAGLAGGCAAVESLPSLATRTQLARRWRRRTSGELEDFAYGFSEARNRALERLRAEAAALGADGVIGVELADLTTRVTDGVHHVTIHLLGTAVRRRAAAPRGGPIAATVRIGPR